MRKNEKSLVLACGLNPNRGSSLLTVLENPEGGSEKCDQVPTSARIRNQKCGLCGVQRTAKLGLYGA